MAKRKKDHKDAPLPEGTLDELIPPETPRDMVAPLTAEPETGAVSSEPEQDELKVTYLREFAIKETEQPLEKPSFLHRLLVAVALCLKWVYFAAANSVYDYFYFVGVQLLRSTRVNRRHLAQRVKHLAQVLEKRRLNRRHTLKTALHNRWRALFAPLRTLRERYRNFRTDLHNARLYGSPGRVMILCLRMAGFFLRGLWRALKYLLNYAAPVAGVVLFVVTVQYFNGLTYALRVEYNGKDMGYITDESVFNQAENDMKGRIINETYIKPDDIIPKFELSVVDPQSVIHADELTDQLIRASGNELEEADGLYIENRFISAVADGDGLLLYMDAMREKYRTYDLDPFAKIEFVKKIQVKRGLYPVSSIVPLEQVTEKLSGEEKGEKRYTVVAGDDGLTIAAKNGIPFADLKLMNPEVDIRLMPGDSLLISQSVPYLGVQVKKTIKYEEPMDFKVEQETDPKQQIGYTHTKQDGEEGVREVTAEVIMLDGIETERNVITRTVLKQPVNRIIVVGGNKPLQVIPTTSSGKVASGAFAWPTAGGSINPGFLGYYGHTGSDISWGGCGGAPIYASADGVVVASGWGGMYGNRIIIEHGGGMRTYYAHASKLAVGVGTRVSQGDTIAYIGRTGNAFGNHLHFEIRVNGTPVNAAPYLYS